MNDPTLKLIQYAQTPLPSNPRLAPWVSVVEIGDNRLHLRGAELVVPLLHPLFVETFYSIRPLLDGDHSLKQIISIGGEKILPTTIEFLLKMLRTNGILQEGNSNLETLDKTPEIENLRQFFSHFTQNPDGMISDLNKTRLGIIGTGQLKNSIINSASQNQIKTIIELSIGQLEDPDIEGKFKNVDFIVACCENAGYSFFESINSVCLKTGTQWMHVSIQGTTGFVGPTIIPYQTACFHCYTKRLLSNSDDPEGFVSYQNHFTKNDVPENEGLLPTFGDLITNETILEIIRIITGFAPPASIGRLIQIKPNTSSRINHEVFRLPRCPICKPLTTYQEIWNTDSLNKNVSS